MAIDCMTREQRKRLRDWHILQAEAEYNERLASIEDAVAGTDLYPRPLTDLNDRRCDYHSAAVFKVPINEVRRKRKSLRYRWLCWLGVVK